jgi:hypothetical protein
MDLSTGSEGSDEEQIETEEATQPFSAVSEESQLQEENTEESVESSQESSGGASQYTDEQLLAAGWTAEQIAQMRGSP